MGIKFGSGIVQYVSTFSEHFELGFRSLWQSIANGTWFLKNKFDKTTRFKYLIVLSTSKRECDMEPVECDIEWTLSGITITGHLDLVHKIRSRAILQRLDAQGVL